VNTTQSRRLLRVCFAALALAGLGACVPYRGNDYGGDGGWNQQAYQQPRYRGQWGDGRRHDGPDYQYGSQYGGRPGQYQQPYYNQ